MQSWLDVVTIMMHVVVDRPKQQIHSVHMPPNREEVQHYTCAPCCSTSCFCPHRPLPLSGVRPLHEAVTWGHLPVLELLLESGADATAVAGPHNNTSLHLAALNGHTGTRLPLLLLAYMLA